MKEHSVHRLPAGAFSAIIGARMPPPEPVEVFQRHFVGQETAIERRFRVPLTSVPEAAAPRRSSDRGPGKSG